MFFKKKEGGGALWVCLWNQGGGGPKKFGNHWCRGSVEYLLRPADLSAPDVLLWCLGGRDVLLFVSNTSEAPARNWYYEAALVAACHLLICATKLTMVILNTYTASAHAISATHVTVLCINTFLFHSVCVYVVLGHPV
jgi:hypothetical protein